MIRSIFIIGIAFCIFVSIGLTENKTSSSFVDKFAGGVLVGEDKIEKVIQIYGQDFTQQHFHGETLCYFDPQKLIYLSYSIYDGVVQSVILSKTQDKEIAEECRKQNIKSEYLITGKGIQLGDSKEKVIHAYGKPEKEEIKNGVDIFEYHTDYEKDAGVALFYDAYLYFKANKLMKLVIHDGE